MHINEGSPNWLCCHSALVEKLCLFVVGKFARRNCALGGKLHLAVVGKFARRNFVLCKLYSVLPNLLKNAEGTFEESVLCIDVFGN